MRIGIDYRIISAGFNIVNRGMGRYTQQQIREVLRLDSQNEYILFCKPDADLSLILPEIRSAPNLSIAYIEMSEDRHKSPNQPESVLRYSEQYQDWIYRQKVDVYHATTPFLFNDTVLPRFDVCPLVATFYDLIPLVFPSQYLRPGLVPSDLYMRAVNLIAGANRLVAISEASRQDAINYLGFSGLQIDVAYPIADPWFRVMDQETLRSGLANLNARWPVPNQFVMTVSALHHSKNFETLLKAYARLPQSLRQRLPLVVVYNATESERSAVRDLTDKFGITGDVILSGQFSENELVVLYNAATILVHPSRYEGFGLPVLEAFKCGTPVITTTSSSLPEIGGDAAILVDPDDQQGFADAIEAVYSNPTRREDMKQRGLRHAEKFDAAQLGEKTLKSYLDAVQAYEDASSVKPHIAIYTPLPPQASGIADYSADLLEELVHSINVEIFVDDGYLPLPDLMSRYVIQHHSAFERRHAQKPFDGVLYEVGASSFHFYMYDSIQKRPGITILHDLVWGYCLHQYYAQAGKLDEFKKELELLEGYEAVEEYELIQKLPPDTYVEALHDFLNRRYMLKRLVDHSLAIIVHDDELKNELQGKYPNGKIFSVRQALGDPLRGMSKVEPLVAREQVDSGSKGFVVGIFGIVDPVKRLEVCLRAFQRLYNIHPEARLLVVGAYNQNYKNTLDNLAQRIGIHQHVYFTGRVTKTAFHQFLAACDVVVNLRYPSRKQTSGALTRAIAAGKPVIITDLPEWNYIPHEFCWRVTPDASEIGTLANYLTTLANESTLREKMSDAARRYFEQENNVSQMAVKYQSVIAHVTNNSPAVSAGQTRLEEHMSVNPLGLNKICELEDFEDPGLIETIRDVFRHEIAKFTPEFPKGAEYRKYWEIGMSIRALKKLNALRPDAIVLGVGAGTETTIFYLANHVCQVVATDLYLSEGWDFTAPSFMLVEPEKVAPYEFDRNRLLVQHMDGRLLRFPDNTFDAIFSSGSIEHFGGFEDVANAAYEMGRVLKPGGVLTLSTEFRVSGPPGGIGMTGVIMFSREEIMKYIVEASGLELVDELKSAPSEQTLGTKRMFSIYLEEITAQLAQQGPYPRAGEVKWSVYPHLLLVHEGYVFGSVHLTLRKTGNYPAKPNEWAKPTQATIESIDQYNESVTKALMRRNKPMQQIAQPVPMPGSPLSPRSDDISHAELNALRALRDDWEAMRMGGWHTRVPAIPILGKLAHLFIRVFQLGRAQGIQTQTMNTMLELQKDFEARLRDLERTSHSQH